ncbi:hypothetical protein IT418_00755 [bacterium]|nr:hypothetical protein [bacterium]
MQSTAQSRHGTTLYLSELSNGLVFTLSMRDVGHGEHEKHVWKSSYPLLDLLYPHWVTKQSVNTPVNFLSQAVKKAEQAFGWKLFTESDRFKVPEIAFGDGVNKVQLLSERSDSGLFSKIVSDKFATNKKRKEVSLGKELLKHTDSFDAPVVVIAMNFRSLEIIECIPKTYNKTKHWEYKSSKIEYASAQEYVDMLVTKKFLPFVSEHVPESQIFNTLLNYTYWSTLTTSSNLVKDLYRALMTSQLSEAGKYVSAHTHSKGHIFLTGELPLFVHDRPRMELALVDGLGLFGEWSITIDEQYQMIPFLADESEIDVFHELATEKSSLWIIPQTKQARSIAKIKAGKSEYQGIYGNLYTYSNRTEIHDFEIAVDSEKTTLKLPDTINVSSVTIDMRTWPVVYGPNTVANSVKIPQWIDRIRKQIKVM